MNTNPLETLRREIAHVLADVIVLVVFFAIITAVHWLTNFLARAIEPDKLIRSALHFFELTLFAGNAVFAVLVLARSVWRVSRALFSNDQVGVE